jgi:O-antigen ligase
MNSIKTQLIFAFLCSFLLSIFFYETAKAWLSVSMFGLLASVLFLNPPMQTLKSYFNQKEFFIFSLAAVFLFCYLPTSSNLSYGWNRIELKAPLLGLAIAFAGMGKLREDKYNLLLSFYVLLCASTAFYTLLNFAFSYEAVTESYLRSKVMPTLINHVRYSIMIAMGAYIAYYLYRNEYRFGIISSKVFLYIGVLLFVFLHVFSVRSGLVAIYGIITAELILFVIKTRRYKLAIGSFILMILLMVTAIRLIPTLQNKWVNTVSDMSTYIEKGYPNYNSLTTRFISYEAAFDIFKKHPIIGCGLGDIKDETDLFFQANYPMIDIPILPHNQFLFYLSATGITGLLLFCFTFYFPLFYKKNRRNKILLMQYVVLTLSFLTEPMLETQLGVAFSILFILLPLTQTVEVDPAI